jgi:zinc transport system permease protein
MRETDMWDALQFDFMQNALIAGIMVSILCGIIGTLVVVNRISLLAGGIAHSAYGGIGLSLYFGASPALGAASFAVVIAVVMGVVNLTSKHRSDTVIGVLWATGMALGIIFVDLTPGYNIDLMSYLFGSILTVAKADIWIMMLFNVAIILVVAFFYKEFLAISYDEEFAFVIGIPVTLFYFVLLIMTALSVVITIRLVGLILVIALLTIPPYIAENYVHSLGTMMVFSALLGIFFTVCGLYISFNYDLTSGAAIIMVAGTAFFVSKLAFFIQRRTRRKAARTLLL